MRFFIYSRKSKYTGKGESVENQIELCRDYIRLHHPDTTEGDILVFEDEGFSGKSLDRPQFQAMMNEHKKNPANFIVVYSTYNRTKSLNSLGTKRGRCDKSEWIISLGKHNGLIKGSDWVKVNQMIDASKPPTACPFG